MLKPILLIDPNTLIATFDVTNLYSNIPHELGKQAISFWIDKHPDTLHPRFNKNLIIEGIEIILNNNSFQFLKINYIQTLGKAIGTKMAPTYPTLTLAYLEEKLYEKMGKKYSNDIKEDFTKSWKRYLDDCFIFWKHPWRDINELNELLQNLHPKIKFIMEHNLKELPFLDILVKIRKWQNHHRYLPQTNRHPTIPPLQKPPPQKLYRIHPLHTNP